MTTKHATNPALALFQSLHERDKNIPLDARKLRKPVLLDNPTDSFSKTKAETQRRKRAATNYLHARVPKAKRRIRLVEPIHDVELEERMNAEWIQYALNMTAKTIRMGVIIGTVTLCGAHVRLVEGGSVGSDGIEGVVIKATVKTFVISTLSTTQVNKPPRIIRIKRGEDAIISIISRPDVGNIAV